MDFKKLHNFSLKIKWHDNNLLRGGKTEKNKKKKKMVLLTPPRTPGRVISGSSKRLMLSCIGSMSLLALWLKKASRGIKIQKLGGAKPRKFLATISNKAINLRHKKKAEGELVDEDFGDRGLWQRGILMGDKCEPLDFSGVIYYDSNGNRLSEVPMRSPRASPMPSYLYASPRSAQVN
ncbi:hypothetical protein RND71_029305 [Anisodus tanguticus]|uniref:Uncharacterized protein n=1 Tax=Anisodus tanguticus TaxID=243964 RepID=A0AAE1RFP4_9SOLA|nr:hypothetical protein RND71_029305 [Anisodus tanguticus]